jgi:predicted deacylase
MNWNIDEHAIKELATGEVLNLKTYTAVGGPGPHIHIQASVHGAELQGNAVILQLMDMLNDIKINGSITFIPLANPYATNNKHGTYTYGRYNPVTGHNWNRNYLDIIKSSDFDIEQFASNNKDLPWHELREVFKNKLNDIFDEHIDRLIQQKTLSENNKLNLLLQKLAAKSDGILDLHTGPVATRYLYSAEYEHDVSFYLKFKHILVMPDEFGGAMDEAAFMPWIHLSKALEKLGRDIKLDIESFTLEFGSEETFCMKNASKDVESIVNYLKYKGVIEGEPDMIDSSSCLLENYRTIYSPNGGLVDYHFEPGQRYLKGDILASFYNLKNIDPKNPILSSRSTVIAEENGIIINRCPSSSVHQGMELFQVMTKLTEHKA